MVQAHVAGTLLIMILTVLSRLAQWTADREVGLGPIYNASGSIRMAVTVFIHPALGTSKVEAHVAGTLVIIIITVLSSLDQWTADREVGPILNASGSILMAVTVFIHIALGTLNMRIIII